MENLSEPNHCNQPNVVFIITDDQGYGDLRCHGNDIIMTPNIDRLHDESVRFTNGKRSNFQFWIKILHNKATNLSL